jgi:hypothetical protein
MVVWARVAGGCAVLVLEAMGCKAQKIMPDDRTVDAATIAPQSADAAPDVTDAAPDGVDASADADDPDACVPGDTWDAKMEITYGPDRYMPKMITQRTLDVVLLRTKQRKTVYPICAQTGGGCGDCSKPHTADGVSCVLTPTHAYVEIGTDDFSTTVNIVQRGNSIVADWTRGPIAPTPGATGPTYDKSTDVLIKLPCAVKIRFVR